MSQVYNIYHKKKRNLFFGLSVINQLIIINILAFIFSILIINIFGEDFFLANFSLSPLLILSGEKLWTFFTSMFMHGSFFHIFANMFSLFFIGNFLEGIIGRKRFFWVYIISGLIGGIFFVLAGSIFAGNIPGVGASGAIFGLLGVLAVLVPHSKIYLIAGPLIIIIIDAVLFKFIPGNLVSLFSSILNVLLFIMIFAIFSMNSRFRKLAVPIELPMWLLPIIAIIPLLLVEFVLEISLPIGNSAHIGGLVVGLTYGVYLRKKFPKKTERLRNYFR